MITDLLFLECFALNYSNQQVALSTYVSNDGTFEGCKIKFIEKKFDMCKLSSNLSSNHIVSFIMKAVNEKRSGLP